MDSSVTRSTRAIGLAVCHCRECQRQSGSAFGMSLAVPHRAFRLVSGALKSFEAVCDSGRTKTCAFCPECGTRIYHETVNGMSVKPGTLDDTSEELRPAYKQIPLNFGQSSHAPDFLPINPNGRRRSQRKCFWTLRPITTSSLTAGLHLTLCAMVPAPYSDCCTLQSTLQGSSSGNHRSAGSRPRPLQPLHAQYYCADLSGSTLIAVFWL